MAPRGRADRAPPLCRRGFCHRLRFAPLTATGDDRGPFVQIWTISHADSSPIPAVGAPGRPRAASCGLPRGVARGRGSVFRPRTQAVAAAHITPRRLNHDPGDPPDPATGADLDP